MWVTRAGRILLIRCVVFASPRPCPRRGGLRQTRHRPRPLRLPRTSLATYQQTQSKHCIQWLWPRKTTPCYCFRFDSSLVKYLVYVYFLHFVVVILPPISVSTTKSAKVMFGSVNKSRANIYCLACDCSPELWWLLYRCNWSRRGGSRAQPPLV